MVNGAKDAARRSIDGRDSRKLERARDSTGREAGEEGAELAELMEFVELAETNE